MPKEIITHINGVAISPNYIQNLPSNPKLKDWSKKLRKAGNYPEVVFWKQVNRKQFYGIDFDRQRIIGNYIVDFYVKSLGLVVEIDGTVHNEQEMYDERRDKFLVSLGLNVYRISFYSILHDLDNVMLNLEKHIIENYGD
nr:endonuclease domain-containing protein [uncultured Flavobacterium sp.]